MSEKDYGEPWRVMPAKSVHGAEGAYLMDAAGNDVCDFYTYEHDPHGVQRAMLPFPDGKEKAERARNCVNALAGVDDPAAWVKEVRKALVYAEEAMCQATFVKGVNRSDLNHAVDRARALLALLPKDGA